MLTIAELPPTSRTPDHYLDPLQSSFWLQEFARTPAFSLGYRQTAVTRKMKGDMESTPFFHQ